MHYSRPVSVNPGTVLGYRKNGQPIHPIAGGAPGKAISLPDDPESLKEQLRGLSKDQLEEIEASLLSKFDEVYGDGTDPNLDIAELERITNQVNAIRAENEIRATESKSRAEAAAKLRDSIKAVTPEEGGDEGDGDAGAGDGDAGDGDAGEGDGGSEGGETEVVEQLAASLMRAIDAGIKRTVPVENVLKSGNPSLNSHLARAAAFAPKAQVQAAKRPATVFAASSDVPGFTQGSSIEDMTNLIAAMHSRARALPVSNGNGSPTIVASMNRDFRHTLALDSTPEQVEAVLRDVTNVEDMVAAGGWCAPSEINYDFFNIVCEDGMIDIPSVGVVNRGGIRWPTSPTFQQIVAGSPDGLWTWTEADDIAAVTGSPTKDCARILCPTFNEERLVCEGLCVTAGNLTDFAYPEAVANFLRLMFAARAHLTNTRVIGILANASNAVTMAGPTGGFTGDLMNAIDLQSYDYRNRFAMCEDAVLEVVLPAWVFGPLRSDWMRRTGIDDPALANASIMSWFDARNVRVQFVQDWQVRASGKPGFITGNGLTNWPATVQFMIYAPGTFVRGQGLRLDLGVVRDSTLNATNDHTAAWMEDCYLVAKMGHEARIVTTNICVAGTTGAANIACA